MWGPLLALALLLTVNPLRIGIMLLVLSRPRPMPNLLAYWIGTVLAGLFYLVVPLMVLHATPTATSFTRSLVTSDPNPVAQCTVIAIGVILLLLATLLAVRSVARTPTDREPTPVRAGSAGTSTATSDPQTLPIISRLVRPASEVVPDTSSRVRRLLSRAREAWQNGSPWIAFVIGLMVMPADGVLLALALIVASGAAVGTQISAAIAFVIIVLAVEEIILVSNVLAPEKTQAALRRLHDWAAAHHRKFMAAILALAGVSLIIQGMGGV